MLGARVHGPPQRSPAPALGAVGDSVGLDATAPIVPSRPLKAVHQAFHEPIQQPKCKSVPVCGSLSAVLPQPPLAPFSPWLFYLFSPCATLFTAVVITLVSSGRSTHTSPK